MSDIEAATGVAQAYFDEMLSWELWSATAASGDEGQDERYDKLKHIFEKYLSRRALAHNQSRYEFLDYEDPPEFSQKIVRAEPAENNSVWVYVPFGASGGLARYRLKKEADNWKIDSKETDIANRGTWKKRLDL